MVRTREKPVFRLPLNPLCFFSGMQNLREKLIFIQKIKNCFLRDQTILLKSDFLSILTIYQKV